MYAGILTPSLDVVKPYPLKMDRLPVLEVEQFNTGLPATAQPYSVYRNHIYVYPKSVKCDNIKNVKVRDVLVFYCYCYIYDAKSQCQGMRGGALPDLEMPPNPLPLFLFLSDLQHS